MKLRASIAFVLLSLSLGIATCGEKPVPNLTAIATDPQQAAPRSDNTITEKITGLIEFHEEIGAWIPCSETDQREGALAPAREALVEEE